MTIQDKAAALGIDRQFYDALGTLRVASDETLQHLVAAIGDEPRAPGAIVVVRLDHPNQEVTAVVNRKAEHTGRWRIILEDGGEAEAVVRDVDGGQAEISFSVPFGYHRIFPEGDDAISLIAAPRRCWFPADNEKYWGISLQLYLVRSHTNWGIGDFSDLSRIVAALGELGCDLVGLNPLHQLDLDAPEDASPYSPVSRRFLNVLYISVPDVIGFRDSKEIRAKVEGAEFQGLLARARSAQFVDYQAVAALKIPILQELFRNFDSAPAHAKERFESFKIQNGSDLERNSTFQALRHQFIELEQNSSWYSWPAEFQTPHSDGVRLFVERNQKTVEFYSWLQWIADEQLSQAAEAARSTNMQFGLYRDLAIGAASNGADTWTDPSEYLSATTVGCPPDMFNLRGQDWGFPPPNPAAMATGAFKEFARIVAANMRHAGGLRIDHVMGLARLYCIPCGNKPDSGAYVRYPLQDLLAVLALESHRNTCMVVGEDLGTVPEGFRETLGDAGILSYRVLFFEQDWGAQRFIAPEHYPGLSIAVGGSHDLPTLLGWWGGRDIELKAGLDLLSLKKNRLKLRSASARRKVLSGPRARHTSRSVWNRPMRQL